VVLGICGGFQMLCRSIDDPVETRSGRVDGLGLLDADIVFTPDKVLRRRPPNGYEIHHGRVVRCAETTWFEADGSPQGYRRNRCTARIGTAFSTTTTFGGSGYAVRPPRRVGTASSWPTTSTWRPAATPNWI
jgi:cobyric acid synthase